LQQNLIGKGWGKDSKRYGKVGSFNMF
jgi:hypothetical protein